MVHVYLEVKIGEGHYYLLLVRTQLQKVVVCALQKWTTTCSVYVSLRQPRRPATPKPPVLFALVLERQPYGRF